MRSCRASTAASCASTVRTSTRCSLCVLCDSMDSRSSDAVLGACLVGAVGLRCGDGFAMGLFPPEVVLARGTVGDDCDCEAPLTGLGPDGRRGFFGNGVGANGIRAREVVGEGALRMVGVPLPAGVTLMVGVSVLDALVAVVDLGVVSTLLATSVDRGDRISSSCRSGILNCGETGVGAAPGTVSVDSDCEPSGVPGADWRRSCVADGNSPNLI